jgi:hypothetical protein
MRAAFDVFSCPAYLSNSVRKLALPIIMAARPHACIATRQRGSMPPCASSHWRPARADQARRHSRPTSPSRPRLPASADGLPAAVSAAREAGYGLLLIDTPPSVAATISEVLAVADLVVIPVRPSPNDLRAIGGTLELAKRARRRMVFVVSQATQRARITAEAAILLSQYGTVAPVTIHARVDFATSMTDGRTAGALDPTSRSGAELWAYLRNLLTEEERYAEAESRAAE